jgi:RHS repeat-associated protein
VALPGTSGTVNFRYDPFGRRIQKSTSSVTSAYLYNGVSLIEETNSSGAVVASYTQTEPIDEPLAIQRSGAIGYIHSDGLGSVTLLSTAAGAATNTYSYDSFGKSVASSGSAVNPFQYTARELDPETGLYYYRARYYDPSTGRFMSEDPVRFAAGPNSYMYVFNAPVQWRDQSGRSPGWGVLFWGWEQSQSKLAWLKCLSHLGYCAKTLPETAEGIRQMSDDAVLNTAIAKQELGQPMAFRMTLNLQMGLCENANCFQAIDDCVRQAPLGVGPIQAPSWVSSWPLKWPWSKK